MANNNVNGVGGVNTIQSRTDPGQTVPTKPGEGIIEFSPQGALEMSYQGNGTDPLTTAASWAIDKMAGENAAYVPLKDSPEASTALALYMLRQPQNMQNPMLKGLRPDAAVPNGANVFAKELKAGLDMIASKLGNGTIEDFIKAQLEGPGVGGLDMSSGMSRLTGKVRSGNPGLPNF